MKKITSDRFGDVNTFPVLNSIVSILNENVNNTHGVSDVRYVSKFIANMCIKYKALNNISHDEVGYFYNLLKEHFMQRLNTAYKQEFIQNKKVYTHMKTYIISYYREMLKNK